MACRERQCVNWGDPLMPLFEEQGGDCWYKAESEVQQRERESDGVIVPTNPETT